MVYDWPYWEAVADEVLDAGEACSADAEDSGGPSEAAVPHATSVGRPCKRLWKPGEAAMEAAFQGRKRSASAAAAAAALQGGPADPRSRKDERLERVKEARLLSVQDGASQEMKRYVSGCGFT